eukprot:TRINITY_DN8246_c0_g1_i2.p1 TRINITY_DN8246_c0_g1~~TRINITY_DN8246_c0_g1_i2.p1  ORF type:complete len:304 (+),score=58.65 TRINITY_DN8246_c0_g1_i2:139-1050(+)
MTHLSALVKEDEVVARLSLYSPASWLKMQRLSRVLGLRLSDNSRLAALQRFLIGELGLAYVDIHTLCEIGDVGSLWLVLARGGGAVATARDAEGATLLQRAARGGQIPMLRLLISMGVSLNAKGAGGYTPLHEACYGGRPEVCLYLLSKRANVDALTKNGSTALLVASREGQAMLCELLIQHMADPDDGGDKGWTPLSVSAGEGHMDVCRVLLSYGASVNGLTGDGRNDRTALQEAADEGHAPVVSLLIEAKADINQAAEASLQRMANATMAASVGTAAIASAVASPVDLAASNGNKAGLVFT